MLYGFCWEIQKERLPFNNQWACAFHTSHYTNENHPMWDSVDDPSKRREIRYGNNIYVLFRALLHCSRFYGQDTLWVAIARGFNTNAATAKTTAEVLTAARRARRGKVQKEVSDTARAADDWIDFLDKLGPYPRMLPDPEVYKVANAFFDSQEKKHLNAAYIPVNGPAHQFPRAPAEEASPPPRRPPSPYVKMESSRDSAERHRPPSAGHKRSASPSTDRNAKLRRFDHDVRPKPRTEPERHGALDQLPTIQPTRSPRRLSQSKPAQSAPHPSVPARREEAPISFRLQAKPGPPASAPTGPAKKEEPAPNRLPQPARPAQPVAQPNAPPVAPRRESAPTSNKPIVQDASAPKPLLESLEKQLAETKRNHTAAPAPNLNPPSQLTDRIDSLQSSMDSATNAISTMMDSMHHVVDGLHSTQDEVAGLTTQTKDLTTTVSQFMSDTTQKLDTVLQALQTATTTIDNLRNEVSELKTQTSPSGPPQSDSASKNHPEIETMIQEQNTRMEKFFRDVQAQLLSNLPQQQQQQPQTLRQAMAAAERDLRRHKGMIENFYHRSGGSVSRAVTERTADFLAVLEEGVRAAQAGLGPPS
jgi:archaellum component FlaC